MAKIAMQSVYHRIYEERFEDLRVSASEGHEVIRYGMSDFAKDMRKNDLITTKATIQSKWDSAVADGVISPFGSKKDPEGFLVIEALETVLHIPTKKRVCMCVSVTNSDKVRA